MRISKKSLYLRFYIEFLGSEFIQSGQWAMTERNKQTERKGKWTEERYNREERNNKCTKEKGRRKRKMSKRTN